MFCNSSIKGDIKEKSFEKCFVIRQLKETLYNLVHKQSEILTWLNNLMPQE